MGQRVGHSARAGCVIFKAQLVLSLVHVLRQVFNRLENLPGGPLPLPFLRDWVVCYHPASHAICGIAQLGMNCLGYSWGAPW